MIALNNRETSQMKVWLVFVLGAFQGQGSVPNKYSNDLNLIQVTSIYGTNGNTVHRPTNEWHSGIAITILYNINFLSGVQFWYDISSTPNNIYSRSYSYDVNNPWYRINTTTI